MAWNEPGKNGGSNKPNDPNNPWNRKKPPQDLEQLLKQAMQKLSAFFGGNGSSGSGNTGLIVALVLVAGGTIALWNSVWTINEGERGVVLLFGKYHKTMQPGLNFTWPAPISTVYRVDVQKIRSMAHSGEMLTEDKNLVNMDYTVQYIVREDGVNDYLFRLADPETTVRQAAESAVRQVAGTSTMDHIINENRNDVILSIMRNLQKMLDEYQSGIKVTKFNITEVHPPEEVKAAFDDVIKAREDQKTYINEANQYARKALPIAEGQALQIVQNAEAYKIATITEAEGRARQFDLIREQYEKAPQVTRQRLYLETMESVLQGNPKIISSGNGNNLMYLPLQEMLKKTPAQQKVINLGKASVTGTPSNNTRERDYRSRQNRGR